MTRIAPTIWGLLVLCITYGVFRAASDAPRLLSPQGCRMSWMSPSYLLQSQFNASWTPLANRYSLLLYREVGWEPTQAMGLPVLFIPGNAGSSHQVRSIASSAARQYFSSPFTVSDEFTGRGAKPMDFYAVDFNEDLSAFHGATLDAQIEYTAAAVEYVLSRYAPGTRILVLGHSMGGVVGTALLPSGHIAALITMSTPHTLPPARLDARIAALYARNWATLRADGTPVVSVCGGATDAMIPSESCVLPAARDGAYRRTVFTSALEGVWTGVGHREMVWCHQVRWRVARAALELGVATAADTGEGARAPRVLDRWLRDGGRGVPSVGGAGLVLGEGEYEVLAGPRLVLERPAGKWTYVVLGDEGRRTWSLYVSQGHVADVGPHHAGGLRVSVYHCPGRTAEAGVSCDALAPVSLKLLPAPVPGKPFPVPDEGADESEGVVFFEAEVPSGDSVAVVVEAGEGARGWVVGGMGGTRSVESGVRLWDLLFGRAEISLPRPDDGVSKTDVVLARLPATALLVYRLVPKMETSSSCAAPLFSPLLVHTSQASELHYYRLTADQPVLLHTHSSAPYVPLLRDTPPLGLNLSIHRSGPSCEDVARVHLSVDWWTSLGRIGVRYSTTVLSWGVGIVSFLLFYSWRVGGQQLSVTESLDGFVKYRMPGLMVVAGAVALVPLGPDYFLGVGDELGVLRAVLAVLLVGVAVGMVCVTWWLLAALMWPFRWLRRGPVPRRPEEMGVRRSTIVSMTLVLVVIFLFVPWQVAFLGCWVTQLLHCITAGRPKSYPGSVPTLASTPVSGQDEEDSTGDRSRNGSPSQAFKPTLADQNAHVLLFMTWLLPLVAPVLVVWVRTIQTAGYTTPFSSDHNVLKVAPVLMLVDLMGRGRPLGTTAVWWRWGWAVVAGIAFGVGGRGTYVVYDAANVQVGVLVACHYLV